MTSLPHVAPLTPRTDDEYEGPNAPPFVEDFATLARDANDNVAARFALGADGMCAGMPSFPSFPFSLLLVPSMIDG